jgi:hypothetical protein
MIEPKAMNVMTSPASHVKPAGRSIFERFGRPAYRRRRLILVTALVAFPALRQGRPLMAAAGSGPTKGWLT